MSERGSFTSQFFYCDSCRVAVSKIMKQRWIVDRSKFPIVHGRTKGSYAGQEVIDFRMDIVPLLEKVICCKVRIAVIGEENEEIFTIEPENKK